MRPLTVRLRAPGVARSRGSAIELVDRLDCDFTDAARGVRLHAVRVDQGDPILVTSQGLFPNFQRDQVHDLIAGIADRMPDSRLVFDAVPEVMLDLVRRALGRERDLAV
jgi:O-methyltransferase involved in polyketide biosynthesis